MKNTNKTVRSSASTAARMEAEAIDAIQVTAPERALLVAIQATTETNRLVNLHPTPIGKALIAALRGIIAEHSPSTPEPVVHNATVDVALLGIEDFADALSVSKQTVRNLERKGEIFSVLPHALQRGKRYPAYLTGMMGDNLTRVLGLLAGRTGEEKHAFFTQKNDYLGGLTPLEVWHSDMPKPARNGQHSILTANRASREGAVVEAASL